MFALPWPLPPVPAARVLAIVGATVIDGTGARPLADAVVVVRDHRIAAVGRRGEVTIPEGARQVDARGQWMVPGLIDVHVHLDEVLTPSAFVLYGVTSVRDMGSRLVTLQRLRARAAKGESLPRTYWLGRNIDEGKPSWAGAVAVKGVAGVPALLAALARQGVDGVKVYVAAGPAVVAAVAREAHRRGWPVAAHLGATTPVQAVGAGVDDLEHAFTLFIGVRAPSSVSGYRAGFAGVPGVDLRSAAMRDLVHTLAAHRTFVTPTLAVSVLPVDGERAALRAYAGWADVPAGWRRNWRSAYWGFISTKGWSRSDYSAARQAAAKMERLVGVLYRAGVPILAGTDTPAPWVLPGAGLLRELEMLVRAGLSPMDALCGATGRAAEALHRAADVGTIRQGRYADLVLLDADPLEDIRGLRRIRAVYLGGREVDRAALSRAFEAAPDAMPK